MDKPLPTVSILCVYKFSLQGDMSLTEALPSISAMEVDITCDQPGKSLAEMVLNHPNIERARLHMRPKESAQMMTVSAQQAKTIRISMKFSYEPMLPAPDQIGLSWHSNKGKVVEWWQDLSKESESDTLLCFYRYLEYCVILLSPWHSAWHHCLALYTFQCLHDLLCGRVVF